MRSLANAYREVFGIVFAFRAASDEERPGYGALRSQLMTALDEAKRSVEREGADPREYAHYAVVALVDETIMTSEWSGAEQWSREPLQMHYFGSLLAGENFFDRMRELVPGADDALLEICFVCLAAGFRGRFYDDPGELDRHRQRLHQQLRGPDLRDERHLTPQAYDRPLERSLTRRHFPWWWAVPFLGAAVGLYVGFWGALASQVQTIIAIASKG